MVLDIVDLLYSNSKKYSEHDDYIQRLDQYEGSKTKLALRECILSNGSQQTVIKSWNEISWF